MNLHSSIIAANAEKAEALQAEIEAWLAKGNSIKQLKAVAATDAYENYRSYVKGLLSAALKTGMQQKQIALATGIHIDTISRIHRANGYVSADTLQTVAETLKEMEFA